MAYSKKNAGVRTLHLTALAAGEVNTAFWNDGAADKTLEETLVGVDANDSSAVVDYEFDCNHMLWTQHAVNHTTGKVFKGATPAADIPVDGIPKYLFCHGGTDGLTVLDLYTWKTAASTDKIKIFFKYS